VRKTFQNLLSEVIGTFALLFALLFIVGPNDLADGLSPLIVGLLIVAVGVSLGGATGYAINTARDLGPRIIHALLPIPGKGTSDWKYAWIPVIGQVMVGIYGSVVYQAVFSGDYAVTVWIGTVVIIGIIAGAIADESKVSESAEATITDKAL